MKELILRQMDYMHFQYGLAYILLAVTLFFGVRRHNHCLPWKWLAFFSLFQGVNEWSDMLLIYNGDSPAFTCARLCLMSLSFACLLEFGRVGRFGLMHQGEGTGAGLGDGGEGVC